MDLGSGIWNLGSGIDPDPRESVEEAKLPQEMKKKKSDGDDSQRLKSLKESHLHVLEFGTLHECISLCCRRREMMTERGDHVALTVTEE